MFEGFGVRLTVTRVGVDLGPSRPGERASRLSEILPVEAWTSAQKALELARIQRFRAMLDAYEAAVVIGFAADRPDALDPGPEHPGAARGADAPSPIPGTSEFFVDELAAVTNTSSRIAGRLAEESYVLVERLPAVWAALADGALDRRRAQVFIDVLGSAADEVARRVAELVLPEAAELSLGRLRARLTRELLAVDADAAERRRKKAERETDVRLYPTVNGMSMLAMEMPGPLAAACWSTVNELAWLRKNEGDPRPIGQLRAGVAADLLLRPWDTSRPPVTAVLNAVVPLPSLTGVGVEPGEVDGTPITAAHVRELLTQLDAVCPGGLQAPVGGSLHIAITDADGALLATTSRLELERIAARGCPTHSDAPCECPVLGKPPAVDRYRPSPAHGGSASSVTAPAGTRTAASPSVASIWITSSRTPTAGPPTATTSVACAAATTA